MLKSYILTALRNLIKNKLYTIINVLGLGAAIASAILGYVNYDFSQSYDRQHENADFIYRINSKIITNNAERDWGIIPMALAPTVKRELPEVERFSRLNRDSGIMRFGDVVFSETLYFADYDFFEIFSFQFIKGSKDGFNEKNAVVISREYADKYFGDVDPIGKQLRLERLNSDIHFLTVVGVTEDAPNNSSMPYNIMLTFEKYHEFYETDDSTWGSWASVAFIQVKTQSGRADIESKLKTYIPLQRQAILDRPVEKFYLDPLLNVAKSGQSLYGNILQPGMPMSAILGPAVGGLMILLTACFNFLHTAITAATRRMKEIGIRKVVGGIRLQLIIQFLTENIILCFFALTFGLLMSFRLVSFYDSLWPYWTFEVHFIGNADFFLFLFALLLFTGIAAGAYPAFYVSSFKPVEVLKGSMKTGKKERFKKMLFVGQFTLTVMGILMVFILARNSEYQRNLDLGYNKQNNYVVEIANGSLYDKYTDTVSRNPAITGIAGSRHVPGRSWERKPVEYAEIKADINIFAVGENYFETIGFDLISGTVFSKERLDEAGNSIIITRKLAEDFNITDPLNSTLKVDGKEYGIIGVMNDFYHIGLWRDIQPLIIRHTPKEEYRNITMRFTEAGRTEISDFLRKEWKTIFPDRPFDGYFQDEVLVESLQVNESIRKASIINSVSIILISCMGLFALISFAVVKRRKEIGIRKVLGATRGDIARLVSKEFIFLLLISIVLGSVAGWYLVMALIDSIFAHTAGFSFIPFLLAAAILFLMAVLTVASQVVKASGTNPVDAIRYE